MKIKTYKSFSVAILVALSLYPPWGIPNSHARGNTNAQPANTDGLQSNTNGLQSNTNGLTNTLYRARINLVCTSTNTDGDLVLNRIITSEFVQECATAMGVTDADNLTLAFNLENSSLEVVDRTTREVVCTPLSFAGGTYLTNANNTRALIQTYVFFDTETEASGLLSATQRLAYGRSGQITSYGLRGSIFYSFTDGTNSPTICQGILAVGSGISQRGGRDQDQGGGDDDGNNGNQGQGNNGNQVIRNNMENQNSANTGNRVNTGNQNTGNNNRNIGITNTVNQGFGTTNVNPGGFGTGANQGFSSNQGVGTGVNQGFTANQGFGTSINQGAFGSGIGGVSQEFGTNVNPGFRTRVNP